MSCPHPRGPVERIVGDFSELVCPDCHARFALVVEDDDPFVDPSLSEICGKLNRAKDAACGREPEHRGDHDYTVDPGE